MRCLRLVVSAVALVWFVAGASVFDALPVRGQSSQPDEIARDRKVDRLLDKLPEAKNAASANTIARQIWIHWTRGPDAAAGETIEEIFSARRTRNLEKALRLANRLTKRLPDYAEGWNQKATILYEMGKLDQSLATIPKVLDSEPRHFGALAGKAMILLRQGRVKLGQKALRKALDIHPFLPERRFLVQPKGDPI